MSVNDDLNTHDQSRDRHLALSRRTARQDAVAMKGYVWNTMSPRISQWTWLAPEPGVSRPTPSKGRAPSSSIRDNHTRGSIGDFLGDKIRSGSRLSVVSAYFTIYAFYALKEQLESIESLRFLFGEPRFLRSLDPEKTDKKAFKIEDEGLRLANRLEQKRVAKECADWVTRKTEIKSVRLSNFLHGKMYHIAYHGVEDAIVGSSNFTVSGLGLHSSNNNIELNLEVDSNRDRRISRRGSTNCGTTWNWWRTSKTKCSVIWSNTTLITLRSSSTLRPYITSSSNS